MTIKHIYWFAYYNLEEPSVRYRAKYPLIELQEKYHISYSIVYPGYSLASLLNFFRTYFSALLFRRKNSIIVFQKIYSNGLYSATLKFLLFCRSSNTLYDIDDADYIRRPAKTIHYFMKKSTVCAAGSTSIIQYIQQYNSNTFLLTSPVIDHGIIKQQLEKTFTIGWIGYYGAHRASLTQLFFPALHKIDFPIKLKLIGVANVNEVQEIQSYFKNNPNISIDAPLNIDWFNEHSVYQFISSFDLGVSPLLDTEFNRGKSAFKLKQCLSCGVPVLGSSVGENKYFLKDGVNGFFCENADDFADRIVFLRNTIHESYPNLSQNALKTFPEFSLDHYCNKLMNLEF